MKKRKSYLFEVLIIVLVASFIGMLSGGAAIFTMNYVKEKEKKSNENLNEVTSIYEKIVNEYYGNIDEGTLAEAAISGMMSILDTNSSYFNESRTSSFNNKMKGEYYGIGAETITLEDIGILVVTVIEGSPAETSGLREGDIITEVNGDTLIGKSATYFTSVINSLKENIKLKVARDNTLVDIVLNAEKIVISSVSTNTYYKNENKIGYIKISLFAANTASQFTTKLSELESSGIDSLIIDVRDNAGGYLSSAATILELFMKKDTTLYKTEVKDSISSRKDSTDEHRTYKVAILMNGSSASASEVLASSFRDNYSSELIGTTSYGKGTVQETVTVSDNTMAKITTKKWLAPNGEYVNGKGIKPTIEVPISDSYEKEKSYDNDNQLKKAIDILSR